MQGNNLHKCKINLAGKPSGAQSVCLKKFRNKFIPISIGRSGIFFCLRNDTVRVIVPNIDGAKITKNHFLAFLPPSIFVDCRRQTLSGLNTPITKCS